MLIVMRSLAWYLLEHSSTKMLVVIERRLRCKEVTPPPFFITLRHIHLIAGRGVLASRPGSLEGWRSVHPSDHTLTQSLQTLPTFEILARAEIFPSQKNTYTYDQLTAAVANQLVRASLFRQSFLVLIFTCREGSDTSIRMQQGHQCHLPNQLLLQPPWLRC